ncbi:MAG: hypothetical protein ABI560_11445 [Myxococcales bacterium]
MESRKAWRNRDRSAGESVLALLEGLRQGLGALGVGLFDDDRADADPDSPRGALNFWDAFDERPCAEIDWERWYRELKREQRVETTCGCGGAHHLYGFLIHGRWALLLVAAPALPSGGAAAIASSLTALAAKLPPAKTAAEWEAIARYEGESPATGATGTSTPAGASGGGGPPVWWVRKLPH